MTEQRLYPREELVAAMICALETGAVSTFCIVKNVSLDGVLLECPLADEGDPFDVGDTATFGDILTGPKALFDDKIGEIVWVYKRHIGLHFDHLIMESPEQLRDWLAERNLV